VRSTQKAKLTYEMLYSNSSFKLMIVSLKALLHGEIFHATCLAMALRDKLHESLHRLTRLAIVKIVARQVA
jgi:hypothetical protein